MATIVILEHLMQKELNLPHLVYVLAERWRSDGHNVVVHYGTDTPPAGDLAIVNIDLTVIPESYIALFDHYPIVVNGATTDISKHVYSQHLITRTSDWSGPVVVKTDANFGGRIDQRLRQREVRAGRVSEIPASQVLGGYRIFQSPAEVPAAVWTNQSLIVERFLPEMDASGYYMRVWIFLGDRERSFRCRADVPLIKSRHILAREPVEVPPEIREWRRRLGFDYGKFDYVIPAGKPVLLDANRTPSEPANLRSNPEARAETDRLAAELYAFID